VITSWLLIKHRDYVIFTLLLEVTLQRQYVADVKYTASRSFSFTYDTFYSV